MTSWTSRIDALLAEKPDADVGEPAKYYYQLNWWNERRLALAAERLREPHCVYCAVSKFSVDGEATWGCDCGLHADLLRILEGR